MAFVRNGLVEAVDFNTLVGNTATTIRNTLNGVLATGSGSLGYGQPPVNQVSMSNVVTADNEWTFLAARLGQIAAHQGTSVVNINPPIAGNTIAFSSIIESNLQKLSNNRFNAALQGTILTNTVSRTETWQDEVVFTHVVSFNNGDNARYFFNTGGQLKITVNHPAGPSTNQMFNDLSANVGTLVISAPAAGQVRIAGTDYNGVTRISGGGNQPVIDSTRGYYGLSSSNVNIFSQSASTGPINYRNSSINVSVQTNGSQGVNNDNGSVITIRTVWKQMPTEIPLQAGTTTTLEVIVPETNFIGNSWGTINITGNQTGN